MKKNAFLLLFAIFSLSGMAQVNKEGRHELRLFYGETLTFDVVNLISSTIMDGLTGTHTDVSTNGAYGMGYRYHVNRFDLGADVSYISQRNEVKIDINGPIDFRLTKKYFLVLPTADFSYLKWGILRLYGGAGLGALVGLKSQDALTTAGENYLKLNEYDRQTVNFAFQVTPFAIGLGNDRIRGFIEAGYGLKGLLNGGFSVHF